MSRVIPFLLDEKPVTREQLNDLHANDPAFRDMCSEYESVIDRIDALETGDESPAEAARLQERRSALREALLALVDRMHH